MGKTLIAQINQAKGLTLAAATEQPGHPQLGEDAGQVAGLDPCGVTLTDDLAAAASSLDVLIDFTIAPATANHLAICAKAGTRMVIGTTGLDQAQTALLQKAGQKLPIVFASNYSIGVNATFKLAAMAAQIFGDSMDIEIIEAHHRHKVDAPSGTALTLGEQIAKALGRDLNKVAVHGRQGTTGTRDNQTIGFHAIRGGELVGEHTVLFTGAGERLEITHRAQSRTNFAEGALRAATWLTKQPPGIYNMMDVLGLS